MDYPEWAPKALVDYHRRLASQQDGDDIGELIAKAKIELGEKLTLQDEEHLRSQLNEMVTRLYGLPRSQKLQLLDNLIVNPAMEGAWKSLFKRFADDEKDSLIFFQACESGILGWDADHKLMKSEKKQLFQDIDDTALRLMKLLAQTHVFEHFNVSTLIERERTKKFAKELGVAEGVFKDLNARDEYFMSWLIDVSPSIYAVLEYIIQTARSERDQQPLIKKPHSSTAGLQYFIKTLSLHLVTRYKQPLHEVVAITAGSVFQIEALEADYVRKIVAG